MYQYANSGEGRQTTHFYPHEVSARSVLRHSLRKVVPNAELSLTKPDPLTVETSIPLVNWSSSSPVPHGERMLLVSVKIPVN